MGDGPTVRVAVIGTGFGARAVAPTFARTEGCEVVEVVTPRDDRAVTALCRRSDVDVISVDSPPFLHLDHVRRVLDGGHAVICEKPFGRHAADAEAMCEMAEGAGVVNLVTYEFRAHPIRTQLRAFVLDGVVGPVEHVSMTSYSGVWGPARKHGWSFDAGLGGGWIHVHASHNIDFLRWTFGEVVEASAAVRTSVPTRDDVSGAPQDVTAEDGFVATMRTAGGVSLVLDATATAGVDLPAEATVVGRSGVLRMLSENTHEIGGRIVLHTPEGTKELLHRPAWGDQSAHDDSALGPWAVLVGDAIRNGAPDPTLATFADGLAAARIMDRLRAGHPEEEMT